MSSNPGQFGNTQSATETEGAQTSAISPAMSQADLSLMVAQTLSLSAQNAVFAQQQANIMHQAATASSIEQLLCAVHCGDRSTQNLEKILKDYKVLANALKELKAALN